MRVDYDKYNKIYLKELEEQCKELAKKTGFYVSFGGHFIYLFDEKSSNEIPPIARILRRFKSIDNCLLFLKIKEKELMK